jgi:hypothetical protein
MSMKGIRRPRSARPTLAMRAEKSGAGGDPIDRPRDIIPPDTALARRGMSKDAVACKYLKRYLPDCD